MTNRDMTSGSRAIRPVVAFAYSEFNGHSISVQRLPLGFEAVVRPLPSASRWARTVTRTVRRPTLELAEAAAREIVRLRTSGPLGAARRLLSDAGRALAELYS